MIVLSDEASIHRKLKKAFQLLMLQRHVSPGIKGWELKRSLGKEYLKIIQVLTTELDRLGLSIKAVSEGSVKMAKDVNSENADKSKFFIVSKEVLSQPEMVSSGWRIDDIAVLAATIAYINSRQGKAPRKQVEEILCEKFPRWKVDTNLDRFVRRGYLLDGDDNMLYIGWRTQAEIDQKTLMNLILNVPMGQDSQAK